MITIQFQIIFFLRSVILLTGLTGYMTEENPEKPRIDYVVPLEKQPMEKYSSTIWYDDFNGPPKQYGEGGSLLDSRMSYGGPGSSMLCLYERGKRGTGGCKVFFGDCPADMDKTVSSGEKFDEVYWRIYVKHQYGWKGSPDKMSRATSLTSPEWAQAMIAHVWSSSSSSLTLDPASGVQGDQVVTRRYNDFERLRWLGNKPVSKFPIHSTDESGYWVQVEVRLKLNTPGKSDGINQLWIDGRLECERLNLDFRGNYTLHAVNAVFLEAYWNNGSPVTQSRWYDNFVISTEPIGPVVCPDNPTIVKTPFRGDGKAGVWQVEVASDNNGLEVVYQSALLPPGDTTIISENTGRFIGKLNGKGKLKSGEIYYLRVQQQNSGGVGSGWSGWHQPFRVE